jgi:hypothetical protein
VYVVTASPPTAYYYELIHVFCGILLVLTSWLACGGKLVLADRTGPSTRKSPSYGFDCSFATLNLDFSLQSCGDLLGNRQAVYYDMILSCRQKFGSRCDATEVDRINQIRRQPRSLRSFRATNFDKIRAPKALFAIIHRHMERNKDNQDPEFIEK